MRLKVDTGADICALNTVDIGKIPIGVNPQPDNSILEGYGPGTIRNLGVTDFKVTYKGKSIQTQFNVIDCPGKPSILGCAQAQELGIITVNIHSLQSATQTTSSPAKLAAAQGKLTKELVLKEYKDCFDKVGRFPGEKVPYQVD